MPYVKLCLNVYVHTRREVTGEAEIDMITLEEGPRLVENSDTSFSPGPKGIESMSRKVLELVRIRIRDVGVESTSACHA